MKKLSLKPILKKLVSLKMHQKMLYIMFITFFLLLTFVCGSMLSLFHKNELSTQFALNQSGNAQILTTFEYISDDMERYLSSTSKAEGLPSIVREAAENPHQEYRVRHILKIIADNSNYFSDAFLVDTNGTFYFLTNNKEQQESCVNLWESGIFDNARHIFYTFDGEGNAYLRRTIYNTYPYEAVCYVVAKLDVPFVCSMLSPEGQEGGAVAILDYLYQPIIRFSGMEEEREQLDMAIRNVSTHSDQYPVGDYYIFTSHSEKADWHVVRVISDSNLVSTYYRMRDGLYTVICLSVLAILAVCYYLSQHFTKSIRQLMGYIKQIGAGDTNLRIPQNSNDDEIAELSRSINLMLDCIDTATNTFIDEIKAKQKIQYELLDFKCRLLQAQVSPHFICNILTAIFSFSEAGDHSKVEALTVLSSRYLRNNLNANNQQINTVMEEFSRICNYLDLFHMVYATEVSYDVVCSAEAENASIPHSLLISLVENSLKHGTKEMSDGVFQIAIEADVMQDRLFLSVTDNGIGFSKEVLSEIEEYVRDASITPKLLGFGISSVIRRLELQYSGRYKFTASNTQPTGTTIHIEIPLQYSETQQLGIVAGSTRNQ